MSNSDSVKQDPAPGTHLIMFQGDTKSFSLSLSHSEKGAAWLRTNLGHAKITRREIIREVNNNETPLGRDWFDIPMRQVDERHFQVTVPICDVGHFEAKCFFMRNGESNPIWPNGSNTVINVEPADTCCSNIIYNAFVRQFGPNKGGGVPGPAEESCIRNLEKDGYAVIPRSGTFRDLIRELDFIVGKLGCRFLQLLPVYTIPTTYARMGRFGSPYAALSFTAVEPGLAEFDPCSTPLEQFIELIDAVHNRNAKIIIDMAINHTGWAASLHETHPEWIARAEDGSIKVPGAWGVLWEDLASLDYSHKGLWKYMADIFLIWCRRGIDGFRCDAGYMIPVAAWKYIVSMVREQYPDTIFFLEGLGGKISVARDILNKANFNWAYSELFQNYDRRQIESYLPGAMEISQSEGTLVHFAETHDNIRLASRSRTFARMRTALCALCSDKGGFAFANGVEWYATEKIKVHGSPSLNWGAEKNQVEHIRRLNSLLRTHPAFFDRTNLKLIQHGKGNNIVLLRHNIPTGKKLLIIANLDDESQTLAKWNPHETGMEGSAFVDLLTGEKIDVNKMSKNFTCSLGPGTVFCLSEDNSDLELVEKGMEDNEVFFIIPEQIKKQRLRAKALDVFKFYKGVSDIGNFDPEEAAEHLEKDPINFCKKLNPFSDEPRVITWQWPKDVRREVMIPPGHFLIVRAPGSFRARIMNKEECLANEDSRQQADGSFFSLFSPLAEPEGLYSRTLRVSFYNNGKCKHFDAPLLFLPNAENAKVKRKYYRSELLGKPHIMLGTNGKGGMSRSRFAWGELSSRYDALIAANINSKYPEDRWIMFTRCRAWLVFQGYSQDIGVHCLDSFEFDYKSKGIWRYHIPSGQGEHVLFTIGIEMMKSENGLSIVFSRHPSNGQDGRLGDQQKVKLILRPDVENRNFHEPTKAYTGPEHSWRKSFKVYPQGFTFSPEQEHNLSIRISEGSFDWEPEWQYMVYRNIDAERGLDPDSDLFSPGYFSTLLKGNQSVELTAHIYGRQDKSTLPQSSLIPQIEASLLKADECCDMDEALNKAMDHYVVKRGSLHTVIAGYPWFLDWGRDSLIFARGLIAAGRTEEARSILRQFGQFEEGGTIPNMIHGDDAGNRDTSDAPLWFFVACSDLVNIKGNKKFLSLKCGKKTIRQILFSIINSYMEGTSNGIKMDPESCLIFSPAHFTWMDTNHPAGTPREGYPVEIQALWFFALTFLSQIDSGKAGKKWKDMAKKVQSSILELFLIKDKGYLSDCLHFRAGEIPRQSEPDDALRPNQLLAITLGAVSDNMVCRNILSSCEELLVPGAIRSLADRPVSRPLPVMHNNKIINDPNNPYQGSYKGDENTSRKPAYHNGTAWTWLFPCFCEAWVKTYGAEGKDTALSWLSSSSRIIEQGCAGHVPEILDGNFPHTQRGCDAQAWGASELLRVWVNIKKLE
ncbi:MAG: glycogen debranching enzyme N-terminal domain-containing protein [Proteobacteria bacterium]|nr:glycogen debranching protein [Desulfobacteraceae bacterium]MBU3980224.1 glycogen debranching enzyme N-terminal domain-containing protein [Pseudomonadota bacterium]MBU4014370.1 glycogen debranching enzyme N-terminal domain-containing protein [Pseudomonadota bacterium]MBU4068430.1 glycogen debranching enzyme N-terminal domain-containing protein [Pseudomonadota bacterium]MBU4100311.1 glycogen debranching enzyme N-terminal domain-containing protein [Pseudomonadota bacterium]